MYVRFMDLKPDKKLRKELDDAYNRVMNSGIYLNGVEVQKFEKEWANYTKQKYCIALGCGYDGLLLAISACEYEGEILVPNLTIPLVYNAVKNCNCESILYSQADNRTYEVGIKVHLYGKLDRTKLNCKYVIGDYCQCHELIPQELMNVWSFYPTKNMGGYGNNGAITTNSKLFYDKIIALKTFQKVNSKMDELQAAFLRVKLKHLKQYNERRKQLAGIYLSEFSNLSWLELPDTKDNVFHQFVIKTKHRDKLKQFLTDKNIEIMIHYENMPDILSLPIAPHLKEKEIYYICDKVKEFIP